MSEEHDYICIKSISPWCKCPRCAGKAKPVIETDIEFPELLKNAGSEDNPHKEEVANET